MSCGQQRRAGEGRRGSWRHLEDSGGLCGTGGSTGVNGTLTALWVTAVRAGRSGRHLQRLQAWWRTLQIDSNHSILWPNICNRFSFYIAVWLSYFSYYSELFFFSNNNNKSNKYNFLMIILLYWNDNHLKKKLLKCNYLKVKSIFHILFGNYVVFSSQINKLFKWLNYCLNSIKIFYLLKCNYLKCNIHIHFSAKYE